MDYGDPGIWRKARTSGGRGNLISLVSLDLDSALIIIPKLKVQMGFDHVI
jgi:hypothetical protein